MEVQFGCKFPSDDIVVLERGGATRVVIHLHGATVLSWTHNGVEQLFVSSKSVFDNKKAIRGGIPIVFPHFGPWPLGPQHGFARIKRWTLAVPPEQDETGAVLATLTLRDDEETRKMWNAEFELVYTVQLHENSLRSVLAVHNTGHANIDFTCLLHTYLRVPDIKDTRVLGLRGVTYIDKVKDGKEFTEDREQVTVAENYDRIYKNAPQTVFVQTEARQRLEMTTSNLPDVVVWNPWEDKAREMADFDDDGWRYMLCVEAGNVVTPVVLEAGATFECSVSFTVNPEHSGL